MKEKIPKWMILSIIILLIIDILAFTMLFNHAKTSAKVTTECALLKENQTMPENRISPDGTPYCDGTCSSECE